MRYVKWLAIALLAALYVVTVRACGADRQRERTECEAKGGTLISTRDGHWCVAGVLK